MSDAEFQVLDELYFLIPFSELKDQMDLPVGDIKRVLLSLARKGWIKVYQNMETELEQYDLDKAYQSYFYLASKSGLLAHNEV